MSLNRREMLRMGAVSAGGLLLSSAAASQSLTSIYQMAPNPTDRLAPLARTPAGISPKLFARAKLALDSHRDVRQRDFMGIVDFSLGSNAPRFHVVHLPSMTAESHLVAHGRGSDPDHSGFLEMFSNDFGSHASSSGTYVTAETYEGKYGLSMKVRGLDWSNNNAEARAIVIHNAWYAEPEMIAQHGKLGRSEGCFAFSRAAQWKVMSRLGGGRMIYADKLA